MTTSTFESFVDDVIAESSPVSELEELLFGSDKPKEEVKPIVLGPNQKMFSDSDMFGWKPTTLADFPVSTYFHETPEELIPKRDPKYIFDKAATEAAVFAAQNGLIFSMVGHAGAGKTIWQEQFAAVTGRAFNRISFNLHLQKDDILGTMQLVKGDTKFVKGKFVEMNTIPCVQNMDEVSRASPAVTFAILQRYFERKEICIDMTGEVIQAHPGVVVCITDNTLGLGDDLDLYATANTQDTSTLNRISMTIKLNYMSKEDTIALILSHYPELSERQAKLLAEFTRLCQDAFQKRAVALPFSPRNFLTIAKYMIAFRNPRKAIELNYLNALDERSAQTVNQFIRDVWAM